MPREDESPTPPSPVSRRKFLATVAVAAAAGPVLGSLLEPADPAESAAHAAHGKHAPAAAKAKAAEAPAAPNGARPDYAVAKTPQEREALEKGWKQTVELVEALRKTPVPLGAEFATGALAPKRLRREAN